jgi:MarR family transcriptional repressor of emrRAB
MSSFAPTEQRIDVTRQQYPAFPREPAVVVRLIKHIYRQVHDQSNALLKPWNLNHAEYNLLMMVYGTEGHALTPSQLGDAAGEKLANITRLTNALCEKGLLQREPSAEDRRKVTLSLSAQGLAAVQSFLPPICAMLDRQMSGLSEREQLQLEKLLKKLLASLDAATLDH